MYFWIGARNQSFSLTTLIFNSNVGQVVWFFLFVVNFNYGECNTHLPNRTANHMRNSEEVKRQKIREKWITGRFTGNWMQRESREEFGTEGGQDKAAMTICRRKAKYFYTKYIIFLRGRPNIQSKSRFYQEPSAKNIHQKSTAFFSRTSFFSHFKPFTLHVISSLSDYWN